MRSKLCMSGKVDGVVTVEQFGSTFQMSDFVDKYITHDRYDNIYEVKIILSDSNAVEI
ncbi:hypothetical protein [Roseivirga sp.]|uniref:hypothetical protein n=1 Tax=Roseivirga sp. TaxID=1964215 RepID=UPI003B517760